MFLVTYINSVYIFIVENKIKSDKKDMFALFCQI